MLTTTLATTIWIPIMGIGLIFTCALLILIILVQKPKGGGLSAAFGGGGGSASAAFGTKTGDVLTYVTVGLFILFLGLAMGLTWAIHPEDQPDPLAETTQSTGTDTEDDLQPLTADDMQGDPDVPDGAPEPTPGADVGQDAEDMIDDLLREAEQDAESQTSEPTETPSP